MLIQNIIHVFKVSFHIVSLVWIFIAVPTMLFTLIRSVIIKDCDDLKTIVFSCCMCYGFLLVSLIITGCIINILEVTHD